MKSFAAVVGAVAVLATPGHAYDNYQNVSILVPALKATAPGIEYPVGNQEGFYFTISASLQPSGCGSATATGFVPKTLATGSSNTTYKDTVNFVTTAFLLQKALTELHIDGCVLNNSQYFFRLVGGTLPN